MLIDDDDIELVLVIQILNSILTMSRNDYYYCLVFIIILAVIFDYIDDRRMFVRICQIEVSKVIDHTVIHDNAAKKKGQKDYSLCKRRVWLHLQRSIPNSAWNLLKKLTWLSKTGLSKYLTFLCLESFSCNHIPAFLCKCRICVYNTAENIIMSQHLDS